MLTEAVDQRLQIPPLQDHLREPVRTDEGGEKRIFAVTVQSVANDATSVAQLAKRTLTKSYNPPPEWMQPAHRTLDEAVFAAYGWDLAMSDPDLLAALLALNLRHERT